MSPGAQSLPPPSLQPRESGRQHPKPKVPSKRALPSQQESWVSFLCSLLLLIVVFIVVFLAFNHYSSPDDSLFTWLWLTASDYYTNLTQPAVEAGDT